MCLIIERLAASSHDVCFRARVKPASMIDLGAKRSCVQRSELAGAESEARSLVLQLGVLGERQRRPQFR
jgi:hypothetical protein